MDDIARELGVSITTVSRALSGKGRISEATRKRVLEYTKRMQYSPNKFARALSGSRTFNIGADTGRCQDGGNVFFPGLPDGNHGGRG